MSARAVLLRGLFAASGTAGVAFTWDAIDRFDRRFDDLSAEARDGWERVASLLEHAPPHLLVPRDPPSAPPREVSCMLCRDGGAPGGCPGCQRTEAGPQ